MREAKIAGWFFFVLGVGLSLLSAWAAFTLAPPSPTIAAVMTVPMAVVHEYMHQRTR